MGLTQVSPTVRVEDGPPRKTRIAKKEDEAIVWDSAGARIVEGKPMEYVDRMAPRVWNVYEEVEVVQETAKGPMSTIKYVLVDTYETEKAALERAAMIGG